MKNTQDTTNKVTLYIGTHNRTGLKYFGKTIRYFTKEDLQKYYHGSGVYWKNYLNKYGDDVTMEVYGIYSLDETSDEYVKPIALKFSIDNNIKYSGDWANGINEDGLTGSSGSNKMSKRQSFINREKQKTQDFFDKIDYNIKKLIDYETYINRKQLPKGRVKSEQECINISKSLSGLKKSAEHIQNNRLSNLGRVTAFDIFKNETVTTTEVDFIKNKNLIGIQAKKFYICDEVLMRGKDLELYAKSKGYLSTNFAYRSIHFKLKYVTSISEISKQEYIDKLR